MRQMLAPDKQLLMLRSLAKLNSFSIKATEYNCGVSTRKVKCLQRCFFLFFFQQVLVSFCVSGEKPTSYFWNSHSLLCPQVTYRVVQVTDDQLEATADGTGAVSVVSTAAFAGASQAVAQVSSHTWTVRLEFTSLLKTKQERRGISYTYTWKCVNKHLPTIFVMIGLFLTFWPFARLSFRTPSVTGAVLAGRRWAERHVLLTFPPPQSAMEQPRPCRCRPPPTQRSHRQEVRKHCNYLVEKKWHCVTQNERQDRNSWTDFIVQITNYCFMLNTIMQLYRN